MPLATVTKEFLFKKWNFLFFFSFFLLSNMGVFCPHVGGSWPTSAADPFNKQRE